MDHEETFLQMMVEDPSIAPLFADWLEDRGDPRGELLRLTHILTQRMDQPNRTALEERLSVLAPNGPGRLMWRGRLLLFHLRSVYIVPSAQLDSLPSTKAFLRCRR